MDERSPADFEVEDFVANDSFLNYHLQSDTNDKRYWEEWLLNNPGKRATAEAAMEMIDILLLRLPATEYRQELERMDKKLATALPPQKKMSSLVRFLTWNKTTFTKKTKRSAIVYLLPVLLLISGGVYFFMQRSSLQNEALVEKHNAGITALQFTLSDNTLVTLAPNSTLRYNKQFGNIDRKVYLDGEAGFHVKKDEAHPFKVYAKELVATVLGTEFNVKKQGDSAVVVELIKGKVKVETDNITGSIILNPDERVLYSRKDHRMLKEAWQHLQEGVVTQQNHIVFRRNNFEEIALKIKTVFGVTLINQSNKSNWRFTGEFNNITAKDIIENICLVEHLNYELKGDSILLK